MLVARWRLKAKRSGNNKVQESVQRFLIIHTLYSCPSRSASVVIMDTCQSRVWKAELKIELHCNRHVCTLENLGAVGRPGQAMLQGHIKMVLCYGF